VWNTIDKKAAGGLGVDGSADRRMSEAVDALLIGQISSLLKSRRKLYALLSLKAYLGNKYSLWRRKSWSFNLAHRQSMLMERKIDHATCPTAAHGASVDRIGRHTCRAWP
jgi:hypothetical protein